MGNCLSMPKTKHSLEEGIPLDLMLGGMVNEPVRGEELSLKLVSTDSQSVYFLVTRDVEQDEELLTLYGEDYARYNYESPYSWYDRARLSQWSDYWS